MLSARALKGRATEAAGFRFGVVERERLGFEWEWEWEWEWEPWRWRSRERSRWEVWREERYGEREREREVVRLCLELRAWPSGDMVGRDM